MTSFSILSCQNSKNVTTANQKDQIKKQKEEMSQTAEKLYKQFKSLRIQSVRPAEGFLKYDYLIPAGFYSQMWDWDGYFIGCHLSSLSISDAKYLKYWALNFINAIEKDGYVTGCITSKGPRPIFGKFAMKPFLNQGVYFYSEKVGDYTWIKPYYEKLKLVTSYREQTQLDTKYGLFFWDNAMQSGADNNVVLTNDENDRSSIIAVDASTFQYSEYVCLSKIASKLGYAGDAKVYNQKALDLKKAMLSHLWFDEEKSFFNIRRATGRPIKRISYSNFIPLTQKIADKEKGKAMITKYLWNENHMLAPFGIRTLSKQDVDYNNENIIVPYSNWQGPVWPIANYLYFVALKNYGFDSESVQLADIMGKMLVKDIDEYGSMHENYQAETGAPLAPTAEQSKDGIFTGFVGWNLLTENMYRGILEDKWLLLTVE